MARRARNVEWQAVKEDTAVEQVVNHANAVKVKNADAAAEDAEVVVWL